MPPVAENSFLSYGINILSQGLLLFYLILHRRITDKNEKLNEKRE